MRNYILFSWCILALVVKATVSHAACIAEKLSGEELHACVVRGHAPAGAYIVANTGEISQADERGQYEIVLPVQGIYCLKAMLDGYRAAERPWLTVPASGPVNFEMWALRDPAWKLNHGDIGRPAQLVIRDSGRPIRGFDLAGREVGSYSPPKDVWHHPNRYFWTLGEYCFMSTGRVSMCAIPDFRQLRKRGWYKGDFHAHVAHGEGFYRVNVQQMNFVCRAQNYDWIWLAQEHANDGFPVDCAKVAEFLSDDRLFLRLNNEFPKNTLGHFGNVGVPPMTVGDYGLGYSLDRVTNLELAEKTVYAHGGVCIPVHPFYGSGVLLDKATGRKIYKMINNELILWLLCRPELVPVVDFFYFREARTEKFWYKLLNRGYTLACSGSSDAAFDVGRTPGDQQATYAKMERIDGESIVKAFREGRTMVSYLGAGVILEIDGKTSGDVLLPSTKSRHLKIDAWADQGRVFALEVIRNGVVHDRRELKPDADGHLGFESDIVETKTAWYVARLSELNASRELRAVASPIYFRGPDFRPPETFRLPNPLPDRIKERIRYLTPAETDSDAWYEELKQMLKEAQ